MYYNIIIKFDLCTCLFKDVDIASKFKFWVILISKVLVIRASFAGDLQSISWMAMALGGISGSLLGGYALNNIQIDVIFFLFSVLPAIQLLSCSFVREKSVSSEILPGSSDTLESHTMNGNSVDEEDFSVGKAKSKVSRRKKNQKKRKKRVAVTNKFQNREKDGSLASQWFLSLKVATFALFQAFRQPIILR